MFQRPITDLSGQEKQPVFITGVPRCGSSWVGETLGNCAGVRYVYEPFNLSWVPALRGHLSHFKYADANSVVPPVVQQVVGNAFRGLQSRKQLLRAVYRGYWRPATRSASRVVVKDPTAPLMADWIAKQFNAKILIITRHPCGFASSLEKLDWQVRVDFLLRQNALMRDHLGCYEDVLRRAMKDKWLSRGAFWSAIHKVLDKQMDSHSDWHFCKYEDLCSDPVGRFSVLAKKLDLDLDCSFIDKIRLGSTTISTDPGSTQRDSRLMSNIWRQRMSPMQVDAVMGMVSEFELDYYSGENGFF